MALPFIELGNLRLGGKLNATNDAIAGGSAAGGTGAALYAGLVGKRIWLDNQQALALSDTTIGTLYAGIYQYVLFSSASTATNARGQIAFWLLGASQANSVKTDDGQYIVTPDGSATIGDGLWSGITLNTVTKGNYGWVQLAGLASIKFRAAVTSAVAGNLAVVTTTSNLADGIADATAITAGGAAGAKNILGVCLEAPANSTISKVYLRNPIFF